MPFSGGGGGQLSNHVHDNTPLQGGPLSFNGTTIGGMSAGDITFSDGAALQTLTYPAVPAGETLTAVAASVAPSWVAAGGSAIYEKVGSQQVAAGTAVLTITPAAPIAFDTVSHFIIVFNGQTVAGQDTRLTVNGLVANYDYHGSYVKGGVQTLVNQTGDVDWDIDDSNLAPNLFCVVKLSADPVTDRLMCQITTASQTGFGTWGGQNSSGVAQQTLSEVKLTSAGGNFQNGSTLDLYKVNI
jgi:hypothetical protein